MSSDDPLICGDIPGCPRPISSYGEDIRSYTSPPRSTWWTAACFTRSLNLESREDVEGHPKVGASWEGFVLREVVERLGARPEEIFFWATHAGAELDLLVVRGRKRYGFELKRTAAPRMTPSIRTALEDLHLDRVDVVYPGAHTFPLAERVRALGLPRLYEDLEPLGSAAASACRQHVALLAESSRVLF